MGWIRIRLDPELGKFKDGSGYGINHFGSATPKKSVFVHNFFIFFNLFWLYSLKQWCDLDPDAGWIIWFRTVPGVPHCLLKKHAAAIRYLYTTCFADRKHCCESGTIYSGPSATFVSAGSRTGTNPIILTMFGNSLEIPYTDCKFTRNNYNQSTRRINQLVNYKNIASKFLFNEINSCMITFFVFLCSFLP